MCYADLVVTGCALLVCGIVLLCGLFDAAAHRLNRVRGFAVSVVDCNTGKVAYANRAPNSHDAVRFYADDPKAFMRTLGDHDAFVELYARCGWNCANAAALVLRNYDALFAPFVKLRPSYKAGRRAGPAYVGAPQVFGGPIENVGAHRVRHYLREQVAALQPGGTITYNTVVLSRRCDRTSIQGMCRYVMPTFDPVPMDALFKIVNRIGFPTMRIMPWTEQLKHPTAIPRHTARVYEYCMAALTAAFAADKLRLCEFTITKPPDDTGHTPKYQLIP